jgi:hypothetical protein
MNRELIGLRRIKMADKQYYGGIAWFLMKQKTKEKETEKHKVDFEI